MDPDQDPKADTRITRFESGPNPFAITDLSSAYAAQASRVQRGISVPGRTRVLIQDEFASPKPSDVWWFMHTGAQVAVEGRTATLSLHGKQLTARILTPDSAVFQVLDAKPLPGSPAPSMQNKNEGIRKLAIELHGVTQGTLAVLLEPGTAASAPPQVIPLADWNSAAR